MPSAAPVLVLTLCAASAAAQAYLHLPATDRPATSELLHWSEEPFMRPHARMQVFYSAAETGAAAFVANELTLRFDGPIPRVGSPGPFAIQRLKIQIGTTAVAQPASVFAANLTQPLTTVFDGAHSYWPDQGTFFPEAWGGLNGALAFPFAQPVTVAIPNGGWFVVDVTMDNNANDGRTHALLDAARASGGVVAGTATKGALGCSAGGAGPAEIFADGVLAPGGALSLHGTNLGAGSTIATLLGASDTAYGTLPLPLRLPGTNCDLLVAVDLVVPQTADANGTLPKYAPSTLLPVPPEPAFQNAILHAQHLAIVPAANPPWGLALSDKVRVALGALTPPDRGVWKVANPDASGAAIARVFAADGLAMRIRMP
jgi:hypothetical protein